MKLGIALRNMGPQSTRELVVECARAAEAAGLHDLWVVDHIAIPPDDAEGSEGRYLDPLATLAFLAGVTRRIGLGTSVLIPESYVADLSLRLGLYRRLAGLVSLAILLPTGLVQGGHD